MKILFVLALTLLLACGHDGKKMTVDSKTIELIVTLNGDDLQPGKDTCIPLKDSAHRDFQIVENSLSDTITVGYGIVGPGVTGEFLYLRDGNNSMLYPETPKKFLPMTKEICIRLYQDRPVKGKLVFRVNTSLNVSRQD